MSPRIPTGLHGPLVTVSTEIDVRDHDLGGELNIWHVNRRIGRVEVTTEGHTKILVEQIQPALSHLKDEIMSIKTFLIPDPETNPIKIIKKSAWVRSVVLVVVSSTVTFVTAYAIFHS